MRAHLLKVTQPVQQVVEPCTSPPHPLPQWPRPHLCLWKRLLLLLLPAAQPSPESTDSRGRGGACLLHPLLLEADEALVDHVHRQILVGQSRFHFTQDGGASWGQVGHSWGVSTGRAGAASALPPARSPGREQPRSAAPTSVCSYSTPTGHHELVLAEGLLVLAPGRVQAGASGRVHFHHHGELCGDTTHAARQALSTPGQSPSFCVSQSSQIIWGKLQPPELNTLALKIFRSL